MYLGMEKILQTRHLVRQFLWTNVGDGKSASIWFDKWDPLGPLIQYVTPRDIHREGFTMHDCLADHVENGSWKWSNAWLVKYPMFGSLQPIVLHTNQSDKVVWKSIDMVQHPFSTSLVWDSIRTHYDEVPWVNMVWFSQCIPKHAFRLWLVMHRKLQTQDRIRARKIKGEMSMNLFSCPLCTTIHDSHRHLFFECSYSSDVWAAVGSKGDMYDGDNDIYNVVARLSSIGRSRSLINVIRRLLLGAVTYMLWNERNDRLFKNRKKSSSKLVDEIIEVVRLRLLTLVFKRSANVDRIMEDWKFPRGLVNYNDDNG